MHAKRMFSQHQGEACDGPRSTKQVTHRLDFVASTLPWLLLEHVLYCLSGPVVPSGATWNTTFKFHCSFNRPFLLECCWSGDAAAADVLGIIHILLLAMAVLQDEAVQLLSSSANADGVEPWITLALLLLLS